MKIPSEFGERFIVTGQVVKRASCIILKADDRKLGNREVAVKVYVDRPEGNETLIARFEEQLKQLRSATHLSLVPIISGGCEDGWLYIAMELISGPSLREVLDKEKGALGIERAIEITKGLVEGLQEIHDKGIVHGHVDSRAVLFKEDEVRLAGYYPGVIDEIQRGMTTGGRLIVEPAYIAPEQIGNPESVDCRADMYALSVLLFEMVTGKRPFASSNPLQMAMMRLNQQPPSPAKLNSSISALLDAAIMKGLARDPKDRFENFADMLDAVTGGKKEQKNPLIATMSKQASRMTTETIPVSMSADIIKDILGQHEKAAGKTSGAKRDTAAAAGNPQMVTSSSAQPQRIDSAETLVEASAEDLLAGSFIALEGSYRGKRFALLSAQAMIGSDTTCDICVSGKDIPPRYAIIVKREGSYYLGPLSPVGIILNGEKLNSAGEVKLERGDILTAGEHKLRFVAPGEVFTLKEDIADRVVDRPKSRINFILSVVVIAALIIGGMVMFSARDQAVDQALLKKRQEAREENRRKETIAELRVQGDNFLQEGKLIEPVEANARRRFEQILELDSNDSYAKRRLQEIEERVAALAKQNQQRKQFAQQIDKLVADGQRYFEAGDLITPPGANAKETFQAVLRLDPQNETALEKIAEIDSFLGNMLAQVEGLLEDAREYKELGRFVEPKDENAYILLKKVLAIDPENSVAKNMLLDMAAESVYEGDRSKAQANHQSMRRAYLVAQSLGVDPQYLEPRMRGAELIKKSRASVIIFDSQKQQIESSKDTRFLDSAEIERRVGALKLKGEVESPMRRRKVFEVQRGK